jgi:hypothetical protein
MVGLFVLRQLWIGRDYLCPNRRRPSCIQLSDRAGGLRHQFGARHARAAAAWLDRCDARRNWRFVLVLLQRLAVGCGYCLHLWRLACVRVCGCVIEEEAPAIIMAHGAATAINLVPRSAGCQPAVRGRLAANRFRFRSHLGKERAFGAAAECSRLAACAPQNHRADRQL